MRTIDEIYDEMKQNYEERCGLVLSDDGDMAIRLYTVAAQVYALETQMEFTKRQAFPQYADGDYLDLHATVRGISRTGETHAVGTMRFYLEEEAIAEVAVPLGTVCTDSAGIEFETTEAGTIAIGEIYCDVAAMASLGGISGNAPIGEITNMPLAPTGVSTCRNITAFVGGSAGEDDETLRARIIASYNALPNGANVAYYEQQAMSIDGVYAVQVLPRVRGTGTVDIAIASIEGVPSDEIVEQVQELIEQKREICVDVLVYAPTTTAIDLTIELDCDDGLYDSVQEKLEDYFSGALLGKAVLLADIYQTIYSVDGVTNYKILQPTADIAAVDGVLPQLGELTISAMG